MARDGGSRTQRNVRVFTVNNESRYVLVRNIPALGVIDDLLKRLSLYGKICEYRILDHQDDRSIGDEEQEEHVEDDRFTDVVWVQYETVNNARHAKVRAVQKPFFGSILHVSYAPQYESREDTLLKLQQRRELLLRRARRTPAIQERPRSQQHQHGDEKPSLQSVQEAPSGAFIGPQLPPKDWRETESMVATPTSIFKPSETRQKPKRRRI